MSRRRLAMATLVATTVGYLVVLYLYIPLENPAIVLLSAVPVTVAGALFGLRFVAIFIGALGVGTVALIEWFGPGFGHLLQTYRGIPILILILMGLVVGRLRDVSDEMGRQLERSRIVEAELRTTQQQLEESLEAKDQLIASVGHQLRTPLTAVLGFAEMLRVGNDTEMGPGEREEMVSHIAQQAFHISATIDDLLVAARIEIGKLEVTRVPIALRAQIAQVIESWDRDEVTSIEITGDDTRAIGDPARVRQILRNLIANALAYGGSDISVNVGVNQTHALVEVSDNGPGLPEDQWDAIFEPYYRYHAEATQPGSVGLGLTVSRGLAQIMEGDLSYRHQDGESVFVLRLPLATS
ncbi:MAG: HAMP domain-containing sensor histidine kinase [Acidimicrobiia bacterium]